MTNTIKGEQPFHLLLLSLLPPAAPTLHHQRCRSSSPVAIATHTGSLVLSQYHLEASCSRENVVLLGKNYLWKKLMILLLLPWRRLQSSRSSFAVTIASLSLILSSLSKLQHSAM